MRKPAVSVIMSEYNTAPEYLDAAIKSILTQTFTDFEFIIIDDCGSNNVAEFVKKYNDKRIRIIKNTSNRGLVYSLNRGSKQSRGKYIVRMDTDDIAVPHRIEILHNFIAVNPEYDVVGSRVIEFTEDKELGILSRAGEKNAKAIMRGDVPVHPSVIIRTKSLKEVGYYDKYNRAEDLALWCKMLLNKKRIYIVEDILLQYRVNPIDYKKRKLRNRQGELEARLHYYPKLGGNLTDYLRIAKTILSGMLPATAVRAYRNKFVLYSQTESNKA